MLILVSPDSGVRHWSLPPAAYAKSLNINVDFLEGLITPYGSLDALFSYGDEAFSFPNSIQHPLDDVARAWVGRSFY